MSQTVELPRPARAGFLTGQGDPVRGVAVATFVLVTPQLEAELASKYGAGVVVATGALAPIP